MPRSIASRPAAFAAALLALAGGCTGPPGGTLVRPDDDDATPAPDDDDATPAPDDDDSAPDDDDSAPDDDDSAPDDDDALPPPSDGWRRSETDAPGPVTFNELLYNPPSDQDLEWIELHNPMVLDLDLSGWRIEGGVDYLFAEGTVLPARGYLVVAADPGLLAAQTGFADALGPFDGHLSNGGERLDLVSNGGRLIDTLGYGDDDPWPVEADGSGFTLAKVDADAASDHAENWSVSAAAGGTPGGANLLDPGAPPLVVELVPADAIWAWDLSGGYPAGDWADPAYDDSAWPTGEAPFFAGAAEGPALATVRVTADNYYGLYLGAGDGSGLRLVGPDPDGSWTTVEELEVEVTAEDHLYLAAWEAPGSDGGPQMTIAEVELPSGVVGTDAAGFEWILGPFDGCPGTAPSDPPPAEADLALLIDDANAAGAWAPPAVEAGRTSGPWGSAVGWAFDDATRYVWADTFGALSVTNADNTYALFRSQAPLLALSGTTELPAIPTTATFRTTFSYDAAPGEAELSFDCLLDDGAVVYLDGVEVLRSNLPAGPIDAGTLATASVAGPVSLQADVAIGALSPGLHVLAVELHQAEAPDPDLGFGCALTARITPASGRPSPTVVLNEVAPAAASPFWVELLDVSPVVQELGGLVLASSAGDELILPPGDLAPGELLALDDVGFAPAAGDVLFLRSADGSVLLDAVRVHDGLRGRDGDGGPWRVPSEASPGAPNAIERTEDVVLNEIQYHRAPISEEGVPVTSRPEEWIELHNRGAAPVDLGGWQLVDAVAFDFPPGTVLAAGGYLVVAKDAAAVQAEHPDAVVLGDFDGRLGNTSDRILLLDARGNPADEVRYFDGGRWPDAADGGGSSLELRDPWADNAAAEAWAASDESARSSWAAYTYRGPAEPSAVGPDGQWDELVLGLLDAGVVLLDDLSVVQDPDGAATELVQDGAFDGGADAWRLLGNHRHSAVVPDPDDPSNPVLRLAATGAAGHMHNHVETTLLQPIGGGEYEISFRARWVSGSNQVHSRLYFNRLPRTTRVAQPDLSGTPGAPNSTAVANIGPTFDALQHAPAVPAPDEPVPVSVSVADPDGVAAVTLWSSVAGGAFSGQPMSEVAPGRWQAALGGQPAGTLVQFYVEAEDGSGEPSTFPAAGPASRALLRFDDGLASATGLHDFRILMTAADADWMHEDVNLMSDDLVGATVVYDESEVFYDVGVRAKGSERGRPSVARLGYGVKFHPEQPFRGSHGSVMLDRSQGVGFGQREVLLNLVMTRAGSVSGEYNDLVQAMTPRPEHTGPAELQLDRFSGLVLDAQFEGGSDGPRFEYELVYYPLSTDDGTPEGLKLPQPDQVLGVPLTDLGDDPEAWRWTYLIKNNEREDDYARIMDLGRAFDLPEPAFLQGVGDVIDVEQWLRAFAFATLAGVVDQYGSGSQHNAQFYVRPADELVLYFPHDLDFFGSSHMDVVGNGDLARLLADPANRRSYYGHLHDVIGLAYNGDYLAPWCDQLGALLPGQDFDGHCAFVDERAAWVLDGAPDAVTAAFPPLGFQITTEGGDDFSIDAPEVVLEGDAWIDVRTIALASTTEALAVTWLDEWTWQVTVPLVAGPNDLTLVAADLGGAVVGSDSIVVTSGP